MTVRVGIIGCGTISDFHAQAFYRHPGAELAACADLVPSATDRSAARFSIPDKYANPRDLLRRADLDAVAICVPPKWHAEYFFEALAEGKHVLVEKPLAMNLEEADRMAEAATISDRIVGVALMHRYSAAYHVLREMIRAGAIGRVRQARISFGCDMYNDSRFRTPELDPRSWLVDAHVAGGGILMSSSIHFLSAISFVLDNPEIGSVEAKIRTLHRDAFRGIEDDVDVRIETAEGTELLLHDSWVANQPFQADFLGEEGRLSAVGRGWVDLEVNGVCNGPLPEEYAGFMHGSEFQYRKPLSTDTSQKRFDGLIADFVQSVQQSRQTPDMPNVYHARNMQAIIDAAYRSGGTGVSQVVDWFREPSREPR